MNLIPLYSLKDITIPTEFLIDEINNVDDQDILVRSRTEKGWSLDIVFDKKSLDWSYGSVFYYWGIENEDDPQYYLDNNLSFSFTDNGEIIWKSYRYKPHNDTLYGYLSSGKTETLCEIDNKFHVTIVFERYREYEECDLENEGGINDQVISTEITNTDEVITGGTATIEITYGLGYRWYNEREKRLGILKIYLNGYPIYKLKDWEEIIPFKRGSENDVSQILGGGTNGSKDIHSGTTEFDINQISYYEYPLTFVEVKNHYLNDILPFYDITECPPECENNFTGI